MKEAERVKAAGGELQQFTGTTAYHQQIFPIPELGIPFCATDGVKYFAEQAGAFWFLDIVNTEIASHLKEEDFIVIYLQCNNGEGDITATDGDEHLFFERHIDVCLIPDGKWNFYLQIGFIGYDTQVGVIMLPSEY